MVVVIKLTLTYNLLSVLYITIWYMGDVKVFNEEDTFLWELGKTGNEK